LLLAANRLARRRLGCRRIRRRFGLRLHHAQARLSLARLGFVTCLALGGEIAVGTVVIHLAASRGFFVFASCGLEVVDTGNDAAVNLHVVRRVATLAVAAGGVVHLLEQPGDAAGEIGQRLRGGEHEPQHDRRRQYDDGAHRRQRRLERLTDEPAEPTSRSFERAERDFQCIRGEEHVQHAEQRNRHDQPAEGESHAVLDAHALEQRDPETEADDG